MGVRSIALRRGSWTGLYHYCRCTRPNEDADEGSGGVGLIDIDVPPDIDPDDLSYSKRAQPPSRIC
eukprot:6644014-Pyramimonas_sp.AAC.1